MDAVSETTIPPTPSISSSFADQNSAGKVQVWSLCVQHILYEFKTTFL